MFGRLFQAMLLALLCSGTSVQALTTEQARTIAIGDSDARIAALNRSLADADARTLVFIQALAEDAVKVSGERVLIVRDGRAVDPVSAASVQLPDDAEDVMVNNRMRGELDTALASIKLFSKDHKVRGAAIQTLLAETDESKLALVEKALAAESDATYRAQLQLVRGAILLGSADVAKRLDAARLMAQGTNRNTKTVLLERLRVEDNREVRSALDASLRSVDASLAWGNRLGAMFSGLSLGSILLLVALGLAITYGLMGVINMAHGELMMVGAYATYVVQGAFQRHAPGARLTGTWRRPCRSRSWPRRSPERRSNAA